MSRVESFAIRQVEKMRLVPNAYAFNPKRRHHWLQRWCIAILQWLECHQYEAVCSIEKVTIDKVALLERILIQRTSIIEAMYREPSTLIIGSKDFAELANMPELRYPLCFQMGQRNLFGLTVRVVPWMTGFVVLPTADM